LKWSNFRLSKSRDLDLDMLHTVMHHSSTSTYIQNVIEIEETFCGRTGGRTFETHFIRPTRRSRPNENIHSPTIVTASEKRGNTKHKYKQKHKQS